MELRRLEQHTRRLAMLLRPLSLQRPGGALGRRARLGVGTCRQGRRQRIWGRRDRLCLHSRRCCRFCAGACLRLSVAAAVSVAVSGPAERPLSPVSRPAHTHTHTRQPAACHRRVNVHSY